MPWHPMAVHFPIALLSVAFVVDVAALVGRRDAWHRFAYVLLVAGTLGAGVAVVTGNMAAVDFRETTVAAAVQDHEDYATLAAVLFLAVSLGRLPLHLRRTGGRVLRLWVAVAAAGLVLLSVASCHGGRLVYELGVGVAGAPPVNPSGAP